MDTGCETLPKSGEVPAAFDPAARLAADRVHDEISHFVRRIGRPRPPCSKPMSRCAVVGDALAAFCATMLANRVLEAEIERLSEAV